MTNESFLYTQKFHSSDTLMFLLSNGRTGKCYFLIEDTVSCIDRSNYSLIQAYCVEVKDEKILVFFFRVFCMLEIAVATLSLDFLLIYSSIETY